MLHINQTGSRHHAPADTTEIVAGVSQTFKWHRYNNVAYVSVLQFAVSTINNKIKHHSPCNKAFEALPGGLSLRDLIHRRSIWISYDPNGQNEYYGVTLGRDIAISAYALRMGVWTTTATLVHELAHVDGAPGGADHQAEGVLVDCLMANLHNPMIMGKVIRHSYPPLVAMMA